MHRTRFRIVVACYLITGAVLGWGGTRKPGLWELTTVMTWQSPPSLPGAAAERLRGGTHTNQVCLTQEMIERYGALLPQSRAQCKVSNKVIKPGSITGDYVCTGMMSGKGALESTWSDPEHATGTVHFIGTFQVGADVEPIEWTTTSTSVFKSSDCGTVRPAALPKAQH